uniref:Uncharacterized protein n=1 Tax=Glossina palpalis gambiensis TaxID=67801 RepID=A0A1B0B1G7_9MUSC
MSIDSVAVIAIELCKHCSLEWCLKLSSCSVQVIRFSFLLSTFCCCHIFAVAVAIAVAVAATAAAAAAVAVAVAIAIFLFSHAPKAFCCAQRDNFQTNKVFASKTMMSLELLDLFSKIQQSISKLRKLFRLSVIGFSANNYNQNSGYTLLKN